MIITEDCFTYWKTSKGGFTAAQLKLLGIDWPPKPGWKHDLLGTEIDDDLYRQIYEAKFLFSEKTLAKASKIVTT